jgi:hypothetical protein
MIVYALDGVPQRKVRALAASVARSPDRMPI